MRFPRRIIVPMGDASVRWRTPRQYMADPCGSASTKQTFLSRCDSATARLVASVVSPSHLCCYQLQGSCDFVPMTCDLRVLKSQGVMGSGNASDGERLAEPDLPQQPRFETDVRFERRGLSLKRSMTFESTFPVNAQGMTARKKRLSQFVRLRPQI